MVLRNPLPNTQITVWGVIWLLIAFGFFGLGIIVGLLAFKVSNGLNHTNIYH